MKIQRFGIEIRKIGTMDALYQDVDKILEGCTIAAGGVSSEMQASAVAHALQDMLKPDKHFSVCCIRECAKVCKVCIPSERMDIYSAIHCISWNEMIPEFRQNVIAMVLDDFRSVLNPN